MSTRKKNAAPRQQFGATKFQESRKAERRVGLNPSPPGSLVVDGLFGLSVETADPSPPQ